MTNSDDTQPIRRKKQRKTLIVVTSIILGIAIVAGAALFPMAETAFTGSVR